MRLPFELTLAPISLWGALLSGGAPGWAAVAAFLSLHLFLYPAATAFNSVYDKDEGAVSGLAEPPPVPRHLGAFAVALALVGLLLAFAAGPAFVLLYCAIVGWTAAYSHPRTRWKASPWASAAAIGLGQGAIGFAAGWAALAPLAFTADFLLGAASAALTALGLYPVTQIFQVDEDRARGDRTLAVALGPVGALRLGTLCLACSGVAAALVASWRLGAVEAGLLAIGYAALALWQLRLAATLDRGGEDRLYRRAMRLLNGATAGFLIFLGVEALRSL